MNIATYATFEVMHGRKSALAEIAARLRTFSRESILYFCSAIGIILKLWQRGDWDRTHYELLVRAVFEPLRADWYCLSARSSSPEIVFHRRQLLLIMKLAIEHCPEHGVEVLETPPGYFGTICLMANDQFHFGLYPFPRKEMLTDRDKIMRVLTEFVAVTEYAGSRLENKIVRAHAMMTRHTDQCKDHSDFIDIEKEYQQLTGIDFVDYEALTFGLFSRCNMVDLPGLQRNPRVAEIREENFHTTAIAPNVISRFFKEFSIEPPDVMKRVNARDYGTNDFTVFRDKPLIREKHGSLVTDVLFVGEKFEAGPYWTLSASDRKFGDRLRRFWGRVFESYANGQLAYAAQLSQGTFVANPRFIDSASTEICDGLLLEGDSLLVMEYKASMFTAESKYSGDHNRLLQEISKKLVRDEAEKRKKGVEQIAEAIKQLFEAWRTNKAIDGIDLTGVKNVYPLLLTLDSLGSTVLISMLLNTYFNECLDRTAFDTWSVRPLFCLDIETLEEIAPVNDSLPISGFLQHWLNCDEKLAGTLMAFPPSGLPARSNRILSEEWQALAKRIEARLFPSQVSV